MYVSVISCSDTAFVKSIPYPQNTCILYPYYCSVSTNVIHYNSMYHFSISDTSDFSERDLPPETTKTNRNHTRTRKKSHPYSEQITPVLETNPYGYSSSLRKLLQYLKFISTQKLHREMPVLNFFNTIP